MCYPLAVLFFLELQDLLPGIINELGSENLDNLKEIAGSYGGAEAAVADDDDDVPDLVENFEDAAKWFIIVGVPPNRIVFSIFAAIYSLWMLHEEIRMTVLHEWVRGDVDSD